MENEKRVLLCIMDGWGIAPKTPNAEKYDATYLANPVHVNELEKTEKFIQIRADGEYVGLPAGQMGNSEVGHLNIGAGRIVYQDLSKINNAIKDGFSKMKNLLPLQIMQKNTIPHYIFTDLFQRAGFIRL